jgi:hypothetical protein
MNLKGGFEMVVRQIKPTNERGVRPPKGQMTWMALAGLAVFVVLLIAAIV